MTHRIAVRKTYLTARHLPHKWRASCSCDWWQESWYWNEALDLGLAHQSSSAKALVPYEDFVRESASANLVRFDHEVRLDHQREGCPLDNGYAACPMHGTASHTALNAIVNNYDSPPPKKRWLTRRASKPRKRFLRYA